ncbi:helix-turn-helix domain-containing protein [Peptoniphilus grossensis]|uniref:helix-turn-helix domain-containing protein n=1 Tax=Peptoniphilus grossensis TaxID=1465756 RepID=UPI0039938854
MVDLTNVGRNIKSLREKSGLIQRQVAEFLDLDQSVISKIEKGEINISESQIDKLANLFCCPLSYILYGNEDLNCRVDYRSNLITKEDLEALSLINKLVLNQFEMDKIARKNQDTK